MTSLESERPTFSLGDSENRPIKAGGVLLYRFNKNSMELLLIESRNVYEDLGGRTDAKDKNIYKTVSRELYEESNKLLKKKDIYKRIKDTSAISIYIPGSKYIIFIIKATPDEAMLTSNDFGDKEFHDNISRKIKWVPLKELLMPEIINSKLNWRLKHYILFQKLKQIQTDNILSKNIFVK